MKSLELTQEQRDKLLEMCNKLFPEHIWGFGSFYTSEVGADYKGLDYLDVTHINHKIPCIKRRYEVHGEKSKDLKILEKDDRYPRYDKVEDGYVDNISTNQAFFSDSPKGIIQGSDYDEVYVEAIHWFEFCIKVLFPKLHTGSIVGYALTAMLYHSENPVDYLYEQFKKIK